MNGVVLLVGGLLLAAVIKLILDRNWMGLLLCVVAAVYKRQVLFTHHGRAFAGYYYGEGDSPYYPADVDDNALRFFAYVRPAEAGGRDSASGALWRYHCLLYTSRCV